MILNKLFAGITMLVLSCIGVATTLWIDAFLPDAGSISRIIISATTIYPFAFLAFAFWYARRFTWRSL